jgi:hypothetical protein
MNFILALIYYVIDDFILDSNDLFDSAFSMSALLSLNG